MGTSAESTTEYIKLNKNFEVYFDIFRRSKNKYFHKLNVLHSKDNKLYTTIVTLSEFIAFIEILKAFPANRLDSSKTYEFEHFKARLSQKDKKHYVEIHFNNFQHKHYFDKVEASIFAAQLQKISSSFSFYVE